MNSTRVNINGALSYSKRTVTSNAAADTTEGDALHELLMTRTKDGFASSAYWGATGEVPPREPDDVTGKNPYRFKDEINRKLVPFPKDVTSFPKTVDYSLTGFHLLKDGGRLVEDGAGMNENQMRQLAAATASLPEGSSTKPRFLYLETTNQRMPGAFSDDVLATLNDGKKDEEDGARRIGEIRDAPLVSGAPDPYRLTSDDYCDLTGVDPASWRVHETDLKDPDSKVDMYRSRYNNVEREGPKRRNRMMQVLRREREADPVALRDTLDASRKDTLAIGYEPWSAKDWMSTTHREHTGYDVEEAAAMNDRNATVPLRNVNYKLSDKHEESVRMHDSRARSKNDGEWATEYADGYQDRFASAEIDKTHTGRSVFDMVRGVYTMDHHFHHPRDDTSRGEMYSPAELVPGQYMSMATQPLHAPNALESTASK